MKWIFLSPHYDDAVLSCGGMIYELIRSGQTVEVWTIFAGEPPAGPLPPFSLKLHSQWGTGSKAVSIRRKEDIAAVRSLGAVPRHFDYPDCIYRTLPVSGQPAVQNRDDLFASPLPAEQALADQIAANLAGLIAAEDRAAAPLTIGGHRDHRLARAAADALHRPLWYYADFPYIVQPEFRAPLENWVGADWQTETHFVSDAGLQAWETAIACYISQLSSFWQTGAEMHQALINYRDQGGGQKLWRPF